MAKSSQSPARASASEDTKFLAAIAADLNEEAPRLIYADWLEEQGDPRAKYVRELVAAVRTLGPSTSLPKSKHPADWLNALGVPLYEGLIAEGIPELRAPLLRLARPIVGISTKRTKDASIPIGASKFGGEADLPKGVDWPEWERGCLGFLGQINLADLVGMPAAAALPDSGLLSFFAYQNYDDGYQPGQGDVGSGDTHVCVVHASFRQARSPEAAGRRRRRHG